jgi:hypothetical protein
MVDDAVVDGFSQVFAHRFSSFATNLSKIASDLIAPRTLKNSPYSHQGFQSTFFGIAR